jgi:uncharacterized membrane protein
MCGGEAAGKEITTMRNAVLALGAAGLGAGLMYLFDPDSGRRRRARLRDRLRAAAHRSQASLATAARDLRNRLVGLAAETRARLAPVPVPDDTLAERVRSHLGRCVRNARSIAVTVLEGRVVLRGPILAAELGPALACVAGVPGVLSVQNHLEARPDPGGVPGLQGGRPPGVSEGGLLTGPWPPALRLLAGAAGAGLVAYGVTRRAPLACVLGTAGLGLLARGLGNAPVSRLAGVGDSPCIDVRKSITLDAPGERVFEFWANYANFPRFMTHIREVTDLGDGRSHWVVAGPGGVTLEWDAVLTRLEPDEVLAWRSEPGSLVGHTGTLRFERLAADRTRVHIRLCYQPPAGLLGHAVAALLGSDPKRKIDGDLLRMKTLIETGHPPHDAAEKEPVPPLEQWLGHPELLVGSVEADGDGHVPFSSRPRLYGNG